MMMMLVMLFRRRWRNGGFAVVDGRGMACWLLDGIFDGSECEWIGLDKGVGLVVL